MKNYTRTLILTTSMLLTAVILSPSALLSQLSRSVATSAPSLSVLLENRAHILERWPADQFFAIVHNRFDRWRGSESETETETESESAAAPAAVSVSAAAPSVSAPAPAAVSAPVALASLALPTARAAVSRLAKSAQPLHSILAIGDSMLKSGLGKAIRLAFSERGQDVKVFARSSTGLSRPDFFDWQAKAEELSEDKKFAAVFVFLGTNDAQGIQVGKRIYSFGTDPWKEVYTERVQAMVDTLCKSTRNVYWVTLPPMLNPKFNARVSLVNSIVKDSLNSCARMVSSMRMVVAENDAFAEYKKVEDASVKIRDNDGIHMSREGSVLVANSLLQDFMKGF